MTPDNPPSPTLFDHVVVGRDCGGCVACCKILKIDQPTLNKEANVLCPHCTGSGCGIYATRPDVCRTWYCLWRRIPALPDTTRPDRIGVVFSLDQHLPPRTPFEKLYIVGRAISDTSAFQSPMVQSVIRMFVEEGSLPVFLSFGGQKLMIFPDPALAAVILNPTAFDSSPLRPRAMEWRRQHKTD